MKTNQITLLNDIRISRIDNSDQPNNTIVELLYFFISNPIIIALIILPKIISALKLHMLRN